MKEHPLQQQIRIECSRGPVRLWRNNVGTGWAGHATRVTARNLSTLAYGLRPGDVVIRNGRPLHAGLCPGSADLIGLQSLTLPSGSNIARFVAIEVKRPHGGRVSQAQANWLAAVEAMGGLAGVVRSVEEAQALLRAPPP